ncbi:DMT family transporter [Peribacillus alkalitolerans]|uniref:DMT family transporter n=1 Tax=Peribacillus alkalitolerans TaxID=1550385 RepID=UPI0013D23476|nr:DMT family transporter [Peribacillus alkalitolerans]
MNKKLLADCTLLLVVFIWGATFVLVQDAISFLEPFSFNAVRFMMAFIILYIWFLARKKQTLGFSKPLLFAGIKMGIWLFIGYAFQTFGLLYTTPAKAGFITGLSVVLVPLFSLFVLKQKPHRNAVIGVIFAATGLYVMTAIQTSNVNMGDILVFFCTIGFAMHIITTTKYAGTYPALELTLIQILTVGLLSTAFSIGTEDFSRMFDVDTFIQPEVLSALIITSVLATAFAFLAQTYFQSYTSPTRVALIFAMEPVFAAITSYLWISERFTAATLAGCIMIFAGMILAELPNKPRKKDTSINEKVSA